jgi:hypothetical protein
MDPLNHFEQELARQFEHAPAELNETIHAVLLALHEKRFQEAQIELQQAQGLADAEPFGWQAQTALAWLLYYFLGGPELVEIDLDQKIELARTLHLDSSELMRLIDEVQHGDDSD